MSVLKVRRVPSPQHVSDKLRGARNRSHMENSTEKSVKSFESTTRTQMNSNCNGGPRCPRDTTNLHKPREPNYVKKSAERPERVLNTVVTPKRKYNSHCSAISDNCGKVVNLVELYLEVLKELKQEVKQLESGNIPCRESPILGIITECFQKMNDSIEYSQVQDSREEVFQYSKMLTGECIEIIERVIRQQSEVVLSLNELSNIRTRSKLKTLLLNIMFGIEHEIINSEKILGIIDTDLHYQSFQLIYCLLKYFITKIASRLKLSEKTDLVPSEVLVNSRGLILGPNSCVHTDSEQIPSYMVECSNRLDKLLEQWTGTGDSCRTDCYHSLTENKNREVILKTVSRFTEEIKKQMLNCRRPGVKTPPREVAKGSDIRDIREAPKMEEQSKVSACSTDMSAFYAFSVTGPNRSRRDSSGNYSQHSNCQRPVPNSSQSRSNCQDCTRSSGSNYRGSSPVSARGRNPLLTHLTNYCNTNQSMTESNNRRMSPVLTSGSYKRNPPPVPHHIINRHLPTRNCNKTFTMTQPLTSSSNIRCLSPPFALQPFPKLQLPNFNTTCNGIGSQRCSHTPRCTNPTGLTLCTRGNEILGANCGKCLVICENNPKPYYHQFPDFKDAQYGSKYGNAVQPQLFNAFSVHPGYGDEKIGDENSSSAKSKGKRSVAPEKHKTREVDRERKAEKKMKRLSSENERKNKSEKKRKSLTSENELKISTPEEEIGSRTPEEERKGSSSKSRKTVALKEKGSISPSDDAQQMNEQQMSTSREDKRQDNKESILKKDKTLKSQYPDSGVSGKENGNPKSGSRSKDSKENEIKDGTMKTHQSEEVPPAKPSSRGSVGKNAAAKSSDSNKPSRDDLRRNEKTMVEDEGGRDQLDSKPKTDKSKSDTDGKQPDDHCTCCKCTKNDENDTNFPMFVNPCHCNGVKRQDSGGRSGSPIFQFFASPMPVACKCQHKIDANKSTPQVHRTGSNNQDTPSSASQKKRDSQDAETQTGKKPTGSSNPNFSEPISSEPSAGQIVPVPSKNDQEPCIENSESCTCSVIYSRSTSQHRKDAQKSESKLSEKCLCPQDLESIFQTFDDKYSKCVQEIKLLIREGYIPRFEGSDESFTLTHEIRMTPSKSKSSFKDDPSKSSPKQQLTFQKSQDKMYSDDSYMPVTSGDSHSSPSYLREEIEELKRLVKNSRIGCPCCKCCKCEMNVSTKEECSKDSDPKKQSSEAKPGLIQSESSSNGGKPPARYTSKEIDESNKEPPKGAKVIHLSPSFVEPELPKSVQNLITPPESKASKVYSSDKDKLLPQPSKPESKAQDSSSNKKGVSDQPNRDAKQVNSSSKPVTVPKSPGKPQRAFNAGRSLQPQKLEISEFADVTPKNDKSANLGLQQQGDGRVAMVPLDDNKLSAVAVSNNRDERNMSDVTMGKSSSDEINTNDIKDGQKNPEQGPILETEGIYAGEKLDKSGKKEQLKWRNGFETEENSETGLLDESKVVQNQGADNIRRTQENKAKEQTNETSLVYDENVATEKQQLRETLVYNTEEEKLQEESLEKEALNQSSDNLFSKPRDNVVKPKDGGVKKSWNPFGSIFGKAREEETSQRGVKFDDGTAKGGTTTSGGNIDDDVSERVGKTDDETGGKSDKTTLGKGGQYDDKISKSDGKLDDGPSKRAGKRDDGTSKSEGKLDEGLSKGAGKRDDGTSKSDGKYDDGTCEVSVDGEYSNIKDGNIEGGKSEVSCEGDDDDDFTYSGSCAESNPCWFAASSCSSIDECKELLDSLPCNFYSEESFSSTSEVIKATETELYVMIIESQPPVAPSTSKSDEIISLLLSGSNNNADVIGNNYHLRNTTRNNNPLKTTHNVKSYTNKTYQNVQSQYPVEIISLQRSHESGAHHYDNIESSDEDRRLPTSRNSSRIQNIQTEMKERKSSSHLKQEKLPFSDPQPEKKTRLGHNKRKHSSDGAVPTVETQIITNEAESAKETESKEVQVTKWNAKVQTAGPRKFNRTGIPKEVEDKLAVHLGLERTAEQTDLKITPVEKQEPARRDGERKTPRKREPRRTSERNNSRNQLKNQGSN